MTLPSTLSEGTALRSVHTSNLSALFTQLRISEERAAQDDAKTPLLDGCVRAAWQTQIAAARQTPGLLPTLLRHRAALLPRFAATYIVLRALPRRVRRALKRPWRASLATVALWLVLGQGPGDAATIAVRGTCTLVHAIRAANTDRASGGCPAGRGADTIVLRANSTHILTRSDNSTYGPTGLPVISSPITIAGRGSRIQRASSAPEFRLLAVSSTGDLTLQETTVSGGVVGTGGSNYIGDTRLGGGVFNGGALTIQHSIISGNVTRSGAGGGVFNGGALTIQDSIISENVARINRGESYYSGPGGGGVANAGALTLLNSTITGNATIYIGPFGERSNLGGGVLNLGGTMTIQHSVISGNANRTGAGGGVVNSGTCILQHSTISGNSARSGDSGVGNTGTLTLQDSTISGNAGSGVFNYGTLTLEHSTIAGNSARYEGGGVRNGRYGTLTLVRTLVSGNTAANTGPEIFNSSYGTTVQANNHNLFGVNGTVGVEGFSPGPSDLVPLPGVGLSDILQPTLAANGGPTLTHALVPGSPALDNIPAADPGCSGTDQRGVPRPHGVGCDIGAVEGGAPTVVNDLVTLVPLPATFRTSPNASGCPPGFVGTFRFSAQLMPQAPSPPLVALVVAVETLSNGNVVQNALGGPQGVGARVPVPPQRGLADGLLRPNEVVKVPLVICLRQKTPFQFFVDVLGVEQE